MIIASITSNLSAVRHLGDHRVQFWEEAGHLRPSLVQAKIVTIEQSIIAQRLGRFADVDLAALDRGLREALSLDRAGQP